MVQAVLSTVWNFGNAYQTADSDSRHRVQSRSHIHMSCRLSSQSCPCGLPGLWLLWCGPERMEACRGTSCLICSASSSLQPHCLSLRLLPAGTIYFWLKDLTQEFLKLHVVHSAVEIFDKVRFAKTACPVVLWCVLHLDRWLKERCMLTGC